MPDSSPVDDLLATLRSTIRGTVAVPGDAGYQTLVSAFQQGIRHMPPVAVDPADAADVATVVAAAAAAGVPVTALGEGHGFHYGITDGVVIRTRSLRSVEVDPGTRTARIGAGTRWQEVIDVSGPLGLVPLSGSDAGVGAVGYVLGGGLGPFGRTYGYAADSVLSFDVVTGEGQLVTVDDTRHPDLWWALRGGNHGLGVVVAMTVRLIPSADIRGNAWYYAASDLEEMLRAWVEWGRDLPKEMNSYAYIARMPDDPALPDPLRGRTLLELLHIHIGEEAVGSELVAPLLDIATPVFHEPGRVREETMAPTVTTDGGVFLDGLDDEGLSAILALAGPQHTRRDVPLVSVGLQLLGGALDIPQASLNAVTGRGARYAFHMIGTVPELVGTTIPEQIRTLHRAVARLHSQGTLPNYIGPSNEPGSVEGAWAPQVRTRLDSIRATYDPAGILTDSHTN
ncbi:FAD-binding protein [Streptomyces olivaceus]|uniref:FAD-binding oxidoreductase n=1 Tax=Streptomyces olivaceus TaxID=47716 RepID=UPI001CCEDC8C|nr:FAD-binding protein [Streptomyces olivaceus]MBZ6083658.1 FAD-binding protein [Streptomyces olivaceus]